jgi:hypothetical protein
MRNAVTGQVAGTLIALEFGEREHRRRRLNQNERDNMALVKKQGGACEYCKRLKQTVCYITHGSL